jgi:hypothetical protein
MTKNLLIIFLTLLSSIVSAQKKGAAPAYTQPAILEQPIISKQSLKYLRKMEDSLQYLSNVMMFDTVDLENRKNACYAFIPKFVRALKTENSFFFKFDSLENVSIVYPPDSAFRIITWQLHYPKGRFRYYGVIQMRSSTLKMHPLLDVSDTLGFRPQATLGADNWYGCIYYNIIKKTINRQNVYTLFGFEAPNFMTRRKVIDVLTFDENKKPKFGLPIFHFKYDSTALKVKDTLSRFFIEYKWDATPTLNFDRELDLIVFDHLAPIDKKAVGAYFAYVPDGTYEGFKWNKDKWQWVETVFTFAINENDNPPIPMPLFGKPGRQPVLPTEVEKY